jgi:uncharacterized protein (TIGR02145 family)
MNNSTAEKAQGICPDNYHIPSVEEWNILAEHLGGHSVAGGKMKESGTLHWYAPNTNATNSSGFTALPAGERDHEGFQLLHEYAVIWSSTQSSSTWANYFYLSYEDNDLHPFDYFKDFAYSVRCLKDSQTGIIENNKSDIRIYPNPCHDQLIVELENKTIKPIHISIINQTGREIKKLQVRGPASAVNLDFLSPGFYILKVEESDFIVTDFFIKL